MTNELEATEQPDSPTVRNYPGYVELVRDSLRSINSSEYPPLFTILGRNIRYIPQEQLAELAIKVDEALSALKKSGKPLWKREVNALTFFYALNEHGHEVRDYKTLAEELPSFNTTGSQLTGEIGISITRARRIVRSGQYRLRDYFFQKADFTR